MKFILIFFFFWYLIYRNLRIFACFISKSFYGKLDEWVFKPLREIPHSTFTNIIKKQIPNHPKLWFLWKVIYICLKVTYSINIKQQSRTIMEILLLSAFWSKTMVELWNANAQICVSRVSIFSVLTYTTFYLRQ